MTQSSWTSRESDIQLAESIISPFLSQKILSLPAANSISNETLTETQLRQLFPWLSQLIACFRKAHPDARWLHYLFMSATYLLQPTFRTDEDEEVTLDALTLAVKKYLQSHNLAQTCGLALGYKESASFLMSSA